MVVNFRSVSAFHYNIVTHFCFGSWLEDLRGRHRHPPPAHPPQIWHCIIGVPGCGILKKELKKESFQKGHEKGPAAFSIL